MDALRLEHLVWAVLFGAVVAAPLGFFALSGSGPLSVLLGVLAFAVSVPLVFRAMVATASPTAVPGDASSQFAVLLAVVFALRVALGAIGVGGFAATAVSLGGGMVAARYASTRFNPVRWRRGGALA